MLNEIKKLPYHLAIIMDGNRRWAKLNNIPIFEAYKKGLEKLKDICHYTSDIGIYILSLYAFSIENWNRDKNEIQHLMNLFEIFFQKYFNEIKKKKIKVVFSGERKQLNSKIITIIDTMIKETKSNNKSILNLAINYSGRNEIIHAVKKIHKFYKKNVHESIDQFDEKKFHMFLFHPDIPSPDFLIRTSGEKRISNFFLWQIAYSEFYFTDILWPNFSKNDLMIALRDFEKRNRRFGGEDFAS